MINLGQITERIQAGFNQISNREFKIFRDVGEFKNSYKADNSNDITRYVNGIMEAIAPSILPIKNLEIITQSFRITFVIDMDALSKDNEGNYIEISQIRNILETYIQENNAIPYYLSDNENKTFEVTPTFGGVTDGLATQLSPIGNVLPLYFDFSCVFVESGINTNTVNFIINGENMFFQEYSTSRTRTAESNMFANSSSQKTLIQANGISINLKMPLLNTEQSKKIEDDVWSGTQNQAVCLEKIRYGENKTISSYNAYIMIYGDNSESGAIGQNIGQVVDLIEGKQDVLIYGEKWTTETITLINNELTKVLNLPNVNNAVVVFWGDGTVNRIDMSIEQKPTTVSHSYNAEKTYTIRYFSY